MQVLLKMWCILVLCPVLLAAGALTLSIDSQLGTSIEDCFDRISIGEQLPPSDVYRNVTELTTRECEQICKQDKQCQAYDYGVGAKGNATCDLSNLNEKELKEKNILNRHPDYDVYVRRFQCEQAPPSPLKPLLDEGDNAHRPVFRPEVEDAKQPLADDYDSRPFETRPDSPNLRPYPPYKPPYLNHLDRPDDYNRPVPENGPPAYGLHRPQDIPFRPERPLNQSFDPYDVLQFQGNRPHYPNWRPDPAYPPRPTDDIPDIYGQNRPRPIPPPPLFRPEEPQYVYITRPNRKPLRPSDDFSYGYGNKPAKPLDYPPSNPYRPEDSRPGYKPNRPTNYPYRPNDYPNYDYNSQYASNYGQNQYNNDNSIYVEIYDPPRPYKPTKPMKDGPYNTYGASFGYGGGSFGSYYGGTQSSHNSYTQSSQSYGSGTITQVDNYNNAINSHKPQNQGYDQDSYLPNKPYNTPKPVYGVPSDVDPNNRPSSSYGVPDPISRPERPYNKPTTGYGTASEDSTNYRPQKPSYTSDSPGYGSGQTSSQFEQSYGSQSSYGSQHAQKPQDSHQKPSYSGSSDDKPSYGGNKPSHDNYRPSYGGNKPSYDNDRPSYVNNKPSYSNQGSYNSQGSYGSTQSTYDLNQGYGPPSYGSGNRPIHSYQEQSHQSSYGGLSQSNGYQESYRPSNQNPYERPSVQGGSYGNKPVNQPSYGNRPYDNPSHTRPAIDSQRPSYNRPYDPPNRPTYDKPDYDSPSYDKPAYNKPPYDERPYDKPTYNDRPTYSDRPTYNKPSSDYDKPTYENKPNYENDRPDGSYGSDTDGGYKNNKPKKNETDGYSKPNIKPVYEYELEKPNNVPSYIVRPSGEVITSRPVTIGDYGEKPGYGREPGLSYKACFRRVLAGKRALRSFVRRVVGCERLEDCRRECAEERRFHCESFNYRQDPSFRGKGLCEMMTKPIEAFDLRRDFVEDKEYDFYELDRNSLEPHCPETLRGPGQLHSGFLSSKPDKGSYQSSWDRNDWMDRGQDRNYNRFYDDRRDRTPGYPGRRRYEDQFFVPYQIGLARTDDDQENWGHYGGNYGNSYYKDRNDYHKSITHWGLNDLEPPTYGVRPLTNSNFNYHNLGKNHRYGNGGWKRGRWNSSGASWNGLDSSETSYYRPPKPVFYSSEEDPIGRSEEAVVKDCTSRRKPGMSLGSGAIRRSLFARTVVQCESACFNEREFKCVSYSYRYSSSHGSDNCFLSERPYRGLDMSSDSGSDVYAMPEHHGCSEISNQPFVESECFWHVRSGAAVDGAAERTALTVAGLGACEAECIRAHTFFCRGFSFRFDAPAIGDDLENCILTSSPPTSLESGRGLRPTAGHELYARGNYGRGCEPALYDDVHQGESGECYLQYDNAARLIGSAIKGHAKVLDERACGQACTDAPFRCLSFSFNNNAADTDNCLLSEIRLFDLQRGVDYEHSADDWLFAFDLFNSQCWRKVHGDHDPPSELPRPISSPRETYAPSGPSGPPASAPSGPVYLPAPPGPPAEPYLPSGPPTGPYKPYQPDYKPSYPGPSHSGPSYSGPGLSGPSYSGPGYLPDPSSPDYSGPSGPYRPPGPSAHRPGLYLPTDTAPDYGSAPFRPSRPPRPTRPSQYPDTGLRPAYPDTGYGPPGPPKIPGPPGPLGPPGYPGPRPDREEEPVVVSWRHYTVSGFPCRKGSSCAQNHVAGHWSCEPEGGEIGSWDYCCAPTHRCGYSEGFHKPWCYVGPSQDQWRPCSEKYYPYHQHNIPHPSQGHRGPPGVPPPRPLRPPPPDLPYLPEADRRYWENLYNNGPQAYYDKYGNPLPGYTRVPMSQRPYIKYHHNYPQPSSGTWVPVSAQELDPPVPGGLGVPRYWPVAYLHKGPPPNTTYFKYNQKEENNERYNRPLPPSRDMHRENGFRDPNRNRDTYNRDNSRNDRPRENEARDPDPRDPIPREPTPRDPITRDLPRDRTVPRERPIFAKVNPDKPPNNNIETKNHRDVKTRNITAVDDDVLNSDAVTSTTTTTTTPKVETVEEVVNKTNVTETEQVKPEEPQSEENFDNPEGIDGKINDFSHSIEVLDIEDAKKGDKLADLKTLEAEEKQIEEIGRLLASRRGSKIIVEKRSQKDLESRSIALDKDLVDFNFGNRFATNERRGTVQRVTKGEIEKERNIDKSLEVSETTYVRPPRVLSTTENIRKAIVNGKVFYSATVREQRDLISNSTVINRRPKSLRPLEEKAPSVIANTNYGKKKVVRTRNVNPVRKVRRVYRRKYNPEEVRRRLLDRERSMKENAEKKA